MVSDTHRGQIKGLRSFAVGAAACCPGALSLSSGGSVCFAAQFKCKGTTFHFLAKPQRCSDTRRSLKTLNLFKSRIKSRATIYSTCHTPLNSSVHINKTVQSTENEAYYIFIKCWQFHRHFCDFKIVTHPWTSAWARKPAAHLQMLQISADFLTRTKCSTLLQCWASLRWQRVRPRIQHQILLFTYQFLNCGAPVCISHLRLYVII